MTRRGLAATVLILTLGLAAWATGLAGGQAHLRGLAAPEIAGGPWINSPPLTLRALRGRVVYVEFWTYG